MAPVPENKKSKGKGRRDKRLDFKRKRTAPNPVVRYFDSAASLDDRNEEQQKSTTRDITSDKPKNFSITFDGATDFVPFDEPAEPEIRQERKKGKYSDGNRSSGKRENEQKDLSDDEDQPPQQEDPFEGRPWIPKETIKKFDRGPRASTRGIRTYFHQKEQKSKEKKISFSKLQAARQEILKSESYGLLETDDPLERPQVITQNDIKKHVDLQSQAKSFDLHLKDFGPYGLNYTRNGRHLLLYGKKGHVAAFDWVTKRLSCEMNVQERVTCASWLHTEKLFAVGQKQWLHIYDDRKTELHCVKKISQVSSIDFLPYHFLLVTGSEMGFLSWLDVSIGQMVAQFNTKSGRLPVLRKNPTNGVVHLGHSNGTVSLWSPNVQEPLVKFLSHQCPVKALDIDSSGRYMSTASTDRRVKVWDLRKYQVVQEIEVQHAPVSLSFSQRGLLAVGMERHVQVFKNVGYELDAELYLQHFVKNGLQQVAFCPYEDVLGVGHGEGFSSLLIPGSGEAHFDALEANPFQTRKQRQEMEVKSLLEKIPADLITLDPTQIATVHEPSLQETLERKASTLFVNVPKVKFTPKFKAAGGAKGWTKRKANVQEEKKREQIKEAVKARKQLLELEAENGEVEQKVERPKTVFDRFVRKET